MSTQQAGSSNTPSPAKLPQATSVRHVEFTGSVNTAAAASPGHRSSSAKRLSASGAVGSPSDRRRSSAASSSVGSPTDARCSSGAFGSDPSLLGQDWSVSFDPSQAAWQPIGNQASGDDGPASFKGSPSSGKQHKGGRKNREKSTLEASIMSASSFGSGTKMKRSQVFGASHRSPSPPGEPGTPTGGDGNPLFPSAELARRSSALLARPQSLRDALRQSVQDPRRKRRAGPPSLRSVAYAIIMMLRLQIAIEVKRLVSARKQGGGGLMTSARGSARGIAAAQHRQEDEVVQQRASLDASAHASAAKKPPAKAPPPPAAAEAASHAKATAAPHASTEKDVPAWALEMETNESFSRSRSDGGRGGGGDSPLDHSGVLVDVAAMDQISVASYDSNDIIEDDEELPPLSTLTMPPAIKGGAGRPSPLTMRGLHQSTQTKKKKKTSSFPDANELEMFPAVIRINIYKMAGKIIGRLYPVFRLRQARQRANKLRRPAEIGAAPPEAWAVTMFDGWPTASIAAVLVHAFQYPYSPDAYIAYPGEPSRYMFFLLSGTACEIEPQDPAIKFCAPRKNARVVATYTAPCCMRETIALVDDKFTGALVATAFCRVLVIPVSVVEKEFVAIEPGIRARLDSKYRATREARVQQLLSHYFHASVAADKVHTASIFTLFAEDVAPPEGGGGGVAATATAAEEQQPLAVSASASPPPPPPAPSPVPAPAAAANVSPIPSDMRIDIRKCSLFAFLTSAQERMLLQRLVPVSYFQGEVIADKGSPEQSLRFVVRGTAIGVNIYRDRGTTEWKEMLFGTWSAGDNFGAKEMYFQESSIYSIKAKTNCDVVALSRSALHQLLASDKSLKQDVANGALVCRASDPKVKLRLHSVRSIPCVHAALEAKLITEAQVRAIFALFKLRIYPANELIASSSMFVKELIVVTTGYVVCDVNSANPFVLDRGRPLGVSILGGMRWRYPIYATTESEAWVLDAQAFGKFCRDAGIFHDMRRLSLEQFDRMSRSLNADRDVLEVRSPQLLFTKAESVKAQLEHQAERYAASSAISVSKDAPKNVPMPAYCPLPKKQQQQQQQQQQQPPQPSHTSGGGGGGAAAASLHHHTDRAVASSAMASPAQLAASGLPTGLVSPAAGALQHADALSQLSSSVRSSTPVLPTCNDNPLTWGTLSDHPADLGRGPSFDDDDNDALAATAAGGIGGGVGGLRTLAQARRKHQRLEDFVLQQVPSRPRPATSVCRSQITSTRVVVPRSTPRALPRPGSLEWQRQSPLKMVGSLQALRVAAGSRPQSAAPADGTPPAPGPLSFSSAASRLSLDFSR